MNLNKEQSVISFQPLNNSNLLKNLKLSNVAKDFNTIRNNRIYSQICKKQENYQIKKVQNIGRFQEQFSEAYRSSDCVDGCEYLKKQVLNCQYQAAILYIYEKIDMILNQQIHNTQYKNQGVESSAFHEKIQWCHQFNIIDSSILLYLHDLNDIVRRNQRTITSRFDKNECERVLRILYAFLQTFNYQDQNNFKYEQTLNIIRDTLMSM